MIERVEVHDPYSRVRQQHEADMLGTYLFLASELMLFGGIFAVALTLRILYPEEVVAASKRLHLWIGGANTAILLTSSLAVALAVQAARAALHRHAAAALAVAAGLGVLFLGMKGIEYFTEYREGLLPGVSYPTDFAGPVEHGFMNLYFIATGLHALHVTVGVCALGLVAWRAGRGSLDLPHHAVVVESAGLYWHLVDVIWVFLYPVLYLAR